MLVIGLTGPTGAGKGEVATLFAAYGLPVLNADEIYHTLLIPPSPCLNDLVLRFGNEILNIDGSLNRHALSKQAFASEEALDDLNAITHGYVMREIRRQLEILRQQNTPAVVLDAPQLFEAGAERDCTVVVSVLANAELRMERIMRRDGITPEAAHARMNAQRGDGFFRTHSDYIIENNESTDSLLPSVHKILVEMGVLSN